MEHSEEANWESMVRIRATKKNPGVTASEHQAIEDQLRSKTLVASGIVAETSKVSAEMAALQATIARLSASTKQLQDGVGVLTNEIDELIFDNTTIQPKQILARLPVTRVDEVKLELDVPCVLCGRYWIENAMVCLPCGCLLHPGCMFRVALSPDPTCPFCEQVPGALWLAQWGFAPKSEAVLGVAVHACNAGMDAAGWLKPLDPIQARARVEEVMLCNIQKVVDPMAMKRPLPIDHVDVSEPHPKRVHLGIVAEDSETEPGEITDAFMQDVCAIGAEAALEAEGELTVLQFLTEILVEYSQV